MKFRRKLISLLAILLAVLLFTPTEGVLADSVENDSQSTFQQVSVDPKEIDTIFSKVSPDGPGAIVTVADNGKIVFQKSYGLAEIKAKTPITPATVFELASCSKQFTAAAILILCERGKLSLDDDIRDYYPELALKKPKGRTLLLCDLLEMTSGLADYSVGMSEEEIQSKKPEEILQWTARQPRKFNPGEKYEYNNGNYALAALLVERISKEKFADFMKREIFEPTGMAHTFVMTAPGMKIHNRAGGYKESKSGFEWARQDTFIPGDGQVMTTADDFVLWDKYLREGKLLKPENQKLAFTSGNLNNGKLTDYGLGWSTGKRNGHDLVDHEGSWDGTSTYILHYLDSGLSIIVLSNNEDFGAGETGQQVADAILN